MRSGIASLAVVVLALAGCGGTNKASTTARTTLPPGVTVVPPPRTPTAHVYTANLSGANGPPAGAPHGSGVAVIKTNPQTRELCWQFSQLVNVNAPRLATLYGYGAGLSGRHGIRLGRHYTTVGCQREPLVLFELLEAHSQSYAIGIYNAQFPEGAVRGRLPHQ
jgi:hypothetical protein